MIKTKKLTSFLEIVITVIGLAILSLLTFFTLTRAVNVELLRPPYEDVRVLAVNGLCFVFLLILAILLWLSRKWLKQVNPAHLFLLCSLITLVVGIYLIFSCQQELRYDQLAIFKDANRINQGNYEDFIPVEGYLNKYPFQLGFVTFERILLPLFGGNTIHVLFLINLACLLGINFFSWQLTAMASVKIRVQNYVILLNFLFLPAFFYIVFAYGSLPGLLCLMASFYLMARYWSENKWYYWLAAAVLAILAYQLKNNYLIGVVALAIGALLNLLRTKKWPNLAFIAVTTLLLVGSSYGLNHYYSGLTHQNVDVSKGIPKNLYFVMGLSKNHRRSDGWYNASTIKTYSRFKGNFKQAQRYGNKELHRKITYFAAKPQRAADFFKKKIVTTWSDPLFQSIWSGPHRQFKQRIDSGFWRQIYNPHSLAYRFIYNFCHALYILILIGALLGSLTYCFIEHKHLLLFLLTYFIGGFCFHLISETKSQYVFNYAIALLPLAATGLNYAIAKLQLGIQHLRHKNS